ncbi:MAG: hypothetical protein AB1611_05505 [bacterium]
MSLSDSRGFSLIEVIVSVVFLLITISGLLASYNYMSSRADKMRWKRSALRIVQQKVEEFMANPQNGYRANEEIDVSITPLYKIRSTVTVKENPADQTLEWRITWNERQDISISLTTIAGE